MKGQPLYLETRFGGIDDDGEPVGPQYQAAKCQSAAAATFALRACARSAGKQRRRCSLAEHMRSPKEGPT